MKILLSLLFILSAIIFISAQIQTNTSRNRIIQHDNSGEAKVNQVLNDSGIYFKQGLISLEDNRRNQARVDFDKSLEVFLMSSINIKSSAKLTNCYDQLIETVYRLEFPTGKTPQIKALTATCGWYIDENLITGALKSVEDLSQGFYSQKFLHSPLDELSIIETKEERIGAKPPKVNGQYPVILKYIDENFHDPYSVKFVYWDDPIEVRYKGISFWKISVKLRAKNAYNAYRLTIMHFYIKHNKVIFSDESKEVRVFD